MDLRPCDVEEGGDRGDEGGLVVVKVVEGQREGGGDLDSILSPDLDLVVDAALQLHPDDSAAEREQCRERWRKRQHGG